MALELNTNGTDSGSLTSGDTISVEIRTAQAEYFEVLVDNNAGGDPSGYDLTVEFYSTVTDSYFDADSASASTSQNPDVTDLARAQKVRVTVNANATDDYRLSVESFKEI